MAAHSGGPFDMTVDPEALMKSLIERRAGKGKYRQSISKSLFDLLPKMKDVQEFHNFLLNPLNRDGMDVIHRQNRNGVTPLMLSSSGDHPKVVERLLAANADPSLADKNGRTALGRLDGRSLHTIAQSKGHAECVRLLKGALLSAVHLVYRVYVRTCRCACTCACTWTCMGQV